MNVTKKLWGLIGRLLYYAAWPALLIYFYPSQRTRVLVVFDEEILVEKAWMGSGRWILPGGGLHRGEKPEDGAIRELLEETGLDINPAKLKPLITGRVKSELLISYNLYAYLLKLKEKPDLSKQKLEIAELQWIHWQKVYNTIPDHHDTRQIIDRWRRLK